MKKISTLVIASSLFIATFNVNASDANKHSIFNKMDFYEFSVTSSSISENFKDEFKTEQLTMIDRARKQASMGNMRTAEGLLKQVAKSIYAMPDKRPSSTSLSYKDSKRMQSVFNAVDSILPHAQKIALEKESDIFELAQVKSDYLRAKDALSNNDATTAKTIIEQTYLQLKKSVAGLRSGDRLYLTIPAPDSREGWQDAAKRFQDWRFLNQYLKTEMISYNDNPEIFEQAKLRADSLYEEASNIALKGEWKAAVEKVDLAYRVLEKSWSESGIDTGV